MINTKSLRVQLFRKKTILSLKKKKTNRIIAFKIKILTSHTSNRDQLR